MRCLITGTRYGRPDVWYWMRRWVKRYGVPERWVLGDNKGAWKTYKGIHWRVWHVGVDSDAAALCNRMGWSHVIHTAHWDRLGSRAGYERNERMVRDCRPGDHALAFPSGLERSNGTWHCAGLANDAGLKVWIVPHVRRVRP